MRCDAVGRDCAEQFGLADVPYLDLAVESSGDERLAVAREDQSGDRSVIEPHLAPLEMRELAVEIAVACEQGAVGGDQRDRGLPLDVVEPADIGEIEGAPAEEEQRREALANLRRGMLRLYGKQPRSADLLLRVEEELRRDLKVSGPQLKKLLDEIEQFRVEMGDRLTADNRARPELRHLDLSRVPAAYRERIQKYFQKLSEQ